LIRRELLGLGDFPAMHHLELFLLVSALTASDGNDAAIAKSSDWWSLLPIQQVTVPNTGSAWGRTPVDSFIMAKLNEKHLAPSPEAGARTLIRRLTYDLHGLPPTPQEVEEFVHDSRPDAYERLVDRLLGSPRYGERWARHWLDIVHYGESHGYDKDKPRANAWPYRDYVIQSLNSDKPFDRFAQEQIAGDVLYPGDPDATIATGFIAAGPWDFVGHVELPETKTDGLIARYNDRDDMVSTTMSTFVSLTVHCARCHDHKFDPITQQDYYRLQAVFAGVDRADRAFDRDRGIHEKRRMLTATRIRLEQELQSLEEPLSKITSPAIQEIDRRLAEVKAQLAKLPEPKAASPSNGYHSSIMATADHEKWVQVDLGHQVPIDEIRLVPARPTDFPDTPGFGFPLRYRIDLSDDPSFRIAVAVMDRTSADQPDPGDEPVVITPNCRSARFVRFTATRLWKRTNDFIFALAELEVLSSGKNVSRGAVVTALDSIEAGRWSTKYLVDGYSSRRPLEISQDNSPASTARQRLDATAAQLTLDRQQQIEAQIAPELNRKISSIRTVLAETRKELAGLPVPSLVYAASTDFARQGNFAPATQPRPIHLLTRGDVKQPGQLMTPGSVASVRGVDPDFESLDPNDEGARRAALARWITNPNNPLTQRSIVNRVWQYHFGRGIVDTPNDFGHMGDEPTHPELLDWLANWFLEHGQSLKALHRLIVTSSVYRQTSQISDFKSAISNVKSEISNLRSEISDLTSESIDGDNRFLWRMNRMRLDAESIRDAALYAAGQLDCTMGGPSLQQFFFKDDHSPVYDYTRFDWDSPAARRRSVYRFIVRSVPDPFMDSFDCPDACQLVPKRNSTLTALQALSLLNNPFAVSQAEQLAGRVRSAINDLSGQVSLAFQLTLGRSPTTDEAADLFSYATTYGLANVCRLLLNSNEFMFVD
jgi:hypothetical protein